MQPSLTSSVWLALCNSYFYWTKEFISGYTDNAYLTAILPTWLLYLYFCLSGQPHIVTTRENSPSSLELIYSHKNVGFVFVFLYATSPFLYGNLLKIFAPNVLGLHVPDTAKADTSNFKDQSNCSHDLHGTGLACWAHESKVSSVLWIGLLTCHKNKCYLLQLLNGRLFLVTAVVYVSLPYACH